MNTFFWWYNSNLILRLLRIYQKGKPVASSTYQDQNPTRYVQLLYFHNMSNDRKHHFMFFTNALCPVFLWPLHAAESQFSTGAAAEASPTGERWKLTYLLSLKVDLEFAWKWVSLDFCSEYSSAWYPCILLSFAVKTIYTFSNCEAVVVAVGLKVSEKGSSCEWRH